ncbi:MAG TPA: class I SAM-dependent methyltransferase [Xanthobacteraceae bacterium]|nr:class I SAM-dependent methyltransferase [Xanthobacteraceae bacterium]
MSDSYQQLAYLEAYTADTDSRVAEDPHEAVGGQWEEIGQLQFDFLIRQGLLPAHSFFDLGCGTLRGGRHFIRYLNPGRYTGIDLSAAAIEYANALIKSEGLESKSPAILVSTEKNLKFERFAGQKFDYLLAQSVFTHLMPEHIAECFAHIGNIMHANSCFYFTFLESETALRYGNKTFSYPFRIFSEAGASHGLHVERCADYVHPRGQRMLLAKPWKTARFKGVSGSASWMPVLSYNYVTSAGSSSDGP